MSLPPVSELGQPLGPAPSPAGLSRASLLQGPLSQHPSPFTFQRRKMTDTFNTRDLSFIY